MQKLVVMQKKSLRIISRAPYTAHTLPLFVKHRLIMIKDLHAKEVVIFMYKFAHNLLPSCCNDFVTNSTLSHGYMLRKPASMFNIETNRTGIRQNCLANLGPLLWDSVNDSLKASVSLAVFKREYSSYILDGYINRAEL
jgi:hypothetical protein